MNHTGTKQTGFMLQNKVSFTDTSLNYTT